MKIAYSLFLQEYIEPDKIDYDDCKTFQIVCAACKEPVFKVSRNSKNCSIDYFSHYRKDETLNKQCELRIDKLTTESINEYKHISKNQRLNLFLKEFQEILWTNEYDSNSREKAKKIFYTINKSETLSNLFRRSMEKLRTLTKDKDEIYDMMDESVENVYSNSSEFISNFAVTTQKEYAYNFLLHILAGHSKSNYYVLSLHAYIKLFFSLQQKNIKSEASEWEIQLYESMKRLNRSKNEKKKMDIIRKLENYEMISDYTGEPSDLFIMFMSHIQYNTYDILLRIPYLNLLKDRLNKKYRQPLNVTSLLTFPF